MLCASFNAGASIRPREEFLRLFKDSGRLEKLSDTEPTKLPMLIVEPDVGSGGATQGERRYFIQDSTSKKSTGYCSFVSPSIKHFPSSGRSTKLVRIVKVAWAVRTLELSNTSSPFRSGPRILTQDCGVPA